jgi:hypothetical protein
MFNAVAFGRQRGTLIRNNLDCSLKNRGNAQ